MDSPVLQLAIDGKARSDWTLTNPFSSLPQYLKSSSISKELFLLERLSCTGTCSLVLSIYTCTRDSNWINPPGLI
jgi:hypothetical protein